MIDVIRTRDGGTTYAAETDHRELVDMLERSITGERDLMVTCLNTALDLILVLQKIPNTPGKGIPMQEIYAEINRRFAVVLDREEERMVFFALEAEMAKLEGTGTCVAWGWAHIMQHVVQEARARGGKK